MLITYPKVCFYTSKKPYEFHNNDLNIQITIFFRNITLETARLRLKNIWTCKIEPLKKDCESTVKYSKLINSYI